MCILFLYINPKPSIGKFRLILAANRDEAYKRPAKPAHFWEEDKTVVGGRDLEPGKEGGSWLAISKRGRIAALLNIMHLGEHPPELLGRGSLVADFVKGSLPGEKFLNTIATNRQKYRPFNFLTIEIASENINAYQYCNAAEGTSKIENISDEYLGISNSVLHSPFAKVTAGINQFKYIVQEFGKTDDKKTLNNKLLNFLKDETSHFPDPEMARHGPSYLHEELKYLTSVYVKAPHKLYGTRAHTIVTVDADGKAEFSEWAMKEPIDADQPQWQSSHYSLQLSYCNL